MLQRQADHLTQAVRVEIGAAGLRRLRQLGLTHRGGEEQGRLRLDPLGDQRAVRPADQQRMRPRARVDRRQIRLRGLMRLCTPPSNSPESADAFVVR